MSPVMYKCFEFIIDHLGWTRICELQKLAIECQGLSLFIGGIFKLEKEIDNNKAKFDSIIYVTEQINIISNSIGGNSK